MSKKYVLVKKLSKIKVSELGDFTIEFRAKKLKIRTVLKSEKDLRGVEIEGRPPDRLAGHQPVKGDSTGQPVFRLTA